MATETAVDCSGSDRSVVQGHNGQPGLDRWVDRYLRRVRVGQFLCKAADWLVVCLLVFGSAVLAVKLLLPQFWPYVLWLGCATIPSVLIAWMVARRSPFTRTESVARLDHKLGAGGLLMTLSETPDEHWQMRLPQGNQVWRDSLPKVQPRRFARHLSLPLLFATAACLVPLRQARTTPLLPTMVGQQASGQLEELLSLLEEAAVIEEEEREQLHEEIAKLTEETERVPLTHEKWETIDALRERMMMRLDTGELMVSKAQSAIEALAGAGNDGALSLSAERVEELEQDILDALQAMGKGGSLSRASPQLRSALQQLLKNGKLGLAQDGAERQQLLSDLDEFLAAESGRLGELHDQCDFAAGGT